MVNGPVVLTPIVLSIEAVRAHPGTSKVGII